MKKHDLEAVIVENIDNIKSFDEFVKADKLANIQQISLWGKFQAAQKNRGEYWCVEVKENDASEKGRIVASAMVMKLKLPMGRCWMYVPRGPMIEWEGARAKEIVEVLVKEITNIAKKERAVFLRIDPGLIENISGEAVEEMTNERKEKCVSAENLLKNLGFGQAHAHYQPENTVMLDLKLSEEQLLAQMKPKGRYNIKLAEKKGVKIIKIGDKDCKLSLDQGVAEFYRLLGETTSRDGFSGHDQNYYKKMLEILGEENCLLYLAEFEGKIISGVVITYFGNTAIYYFGSSGNEHRNVMAPYLLQWEAIKEAKKRGYKWYDFLGVAPVGAGKDHPWAGVTDFKEKFGGVRIDYMPAKELVFDKPMFWLMRAVKSLKAGLRGVMRRKAN